MPTLVITANRACMQLISKADHSFGLGLASYHTAEAALAPDADIESAIVPKMLALDMLADIESVICQKKVQNCCSSR
ncbi:hypothetical protein DVH26_03605 [Paenibacillus sp. H1-7]|nr:hypothetical protein DVH26_03605 [Paenibacillus sp. H1-7]